MQLGLVFHIKDQEVDLLEPWSVLLHPRKLPEPDRVEETSA